MNKYSFRTTLKTFAGLVLITTSALFGQIAEQPPLVSINLKEASFNNVLRILSEKTGLKFVADPEIQERRITVNLNNVTPEDAITAIMNSSGLAYRKIDGIDIYFVGDVRKIQQHTVIKNYRCQYADAVELQNALNRLATQGVGLVLADERTNTLIVRENPEMLANIEELLAELDRPTPQIYIQAAIVEISQTRENDTGVEWYGNLGDGNRIATRYDLRTTTEQPNYFDNSSNRLGIGLPIGQGLGIGIVAKSFDAVLNSLQSDKEVNILSRPYLITLDNKTAQIEVGDQIPYKVLNQYGITSYEFKSATIKLLVKPHINNDKTITVDITPNADFQNGQTSDGTPIIARRTANTTIKIGNGETIVIGGLIRESNTKSISKVPLLGSIPLIGALFRNKIDQKVKTELVVFINPTIVTDNIIESQLQPDSQLSEKARRKMNQLETKTR